MSKRKSPAKARTRRTSQRRGGQSLLARLGLTPVQAGVFAVLVAFGAGAGFYGAKTLFGPNGAEQAAAPVVYHAPEATHAYEESLPADVFVPEIDESQALLMPEATSVPTWLINAHPYEVSGSGPKIAIVIDDMGVDRVRSKKIWELPGPLTLSFMTYAGDLPTQTAQAQAQGHELMLHVSMEPSSDAVDPGPNVLKTSMAAAELKSTLNWGLDRFQGFVGINNHMGSRFTEDARAMQAVLEEVQARGLLFLDSRTSAKSVAADVSRRLGVPTLERNVFLDNANTLEGVRGQLQTLESLARKQGSAIAIAHPRDATIDVLKTWIPAARARGIEIVPITGLLRLKMAEG